MILSTLSASRHPLPPHQERTVSQKKQLTWGEFRCIYTFRVSAYLELSVLRNVWKLVLAALYACGNFEGFGHYGKWPQSIRLCTMQGNWSQLYLLQFAEGSPRHNTALR